MTIDTEVRIDKLLEQLEVSEITQGEIDIIKDKIKFLRELD